MSGGICPRGVIVWGYLSRGNCLGGNCPGVIVLWNYEWLIKSVIIYLIVLTYMDNHGNSRANTCEKSRLLEGMYLLD